VPEFEKRLQEHMEKEQYYAVLEAIRTTGKLEADTEAKLQEAITELLKEF
jgi:F0F1-type ATP synthase alpha subunit